jgi:tetratricopeptide (TPR) repeat protein
MRKVVLILLLVPALVFAQKPIKPNKGKALSAWKSGKLKEAKEMIDICETDPKLSLDGEVFYYKGLIYASLDTTKNQAFKSLASNALETSLAAFAQADKMAGKKEYYVSDSQTGLPILKSQQISFLANFYISEGVNNYQSDNYEGALLNFEKTIQVQPKDTTAYFYAGLMSNMLELGDKTIKYLNEYIKGGGTSPDAYSACINVYNTREGAENKEKAIALVREAKVKFPKNTNFPRLEIGMLIDAGREEEARSGLETAVANEPNDAILHFYLGYVNLKLKNNPAAKSCFEAALKLDPKHFESNLFLAKVVYDDAYSIKREMNSLGISEKDKKRKFELDKVYLEKLKAALPYWESVEKLKPNDNEVLDNLYAIYLDLDMTAQVKRIEKRYKELGIE